MTWCWNFKCIWTNGGVKGQMEASHEFTCLLCGNDCWEMVQHKYIIDLESNGTFSEKILRSHGDKRRNPLVIKPTSFEQCVGLRCFISLAENRVCELPSCKRKMSRGTGREISRAVLWACSCKQRHRDEIWKVAAGKQKWQMNKTVLYTKTQNTANQKLTGIRKRQEKSIQMFFCTTSVNYRQVSALCPLIAANHKILLQWKGKTNLCWGNKQQPANTSCLWLMSTIEL